VRLTFILALVTVVYSLVRLARHRG